MHIYIYIYIYMHMPIFISCVINEYNVNWHKVQLQSAVCKLCDQILLYFLCKQYIKLDLPIGTNNLCPADYAQLVKT